MPKATSVAFKAHLALELTTLCTCWQITRRDGQVFYFTDHDDDLVVSGNTYVSAIGYRRTAIQSDVTLSIDNLEVTGLFDSTTLVADDIRAGMFDYADVRIFQVNWADLSQGIMRLRRGYLGEVTMLPSGIFQSELRGMLQRLTTKVGTVYTAECRADLGDTQCKKDLASFTFSGTVASVTDARIFSLTIGSPPVDGYLDAGIINWLTGANAGRSMEIKTWIQSGGALTLFLPMPRTVAVADTCTVVAGCNKTLAHCRDKFNNIINRRAEDYIPGFDAIVQTPDSKTPSAGGGGKKGGIG